MKENSKLVLCIAFIAIICAIGGWQSKHAIPLSTPLSQKDIAISVNKISSIGKNERHASISIIDYSKTGGSPEPNQRQGNPNESNKNESDNSAKLTDLLQAVSAAATLVVTAGLLFVGFAQLRVYNRQADIMGTQARIYAVSQRAVISYDIHRLRVHRDPENQDTVLSYNISLIWKNLGLTPAIRVNYWSGHIFQTSGQEIPNVNTLFRTDDAPGAFVVSAGSVLYTDEIGLDKRVLNLLFIKEIRLFVWSAVRWSNTFDDDPLRFTEVAVVLEFVLDSSPETFRPSEYLGTSFTPFRVAVRGLRSQDRRDPAREPSQNSEPGAPAA